MPKTESELGSRLLMSRLVSPEQISKCRNALPNPDDDAKLVELLIQLGILTKWQSAQVHAGRERGFFLEHYKLLDPLGAGGMGQVFRALDSKLGRPVAIKVLPKRLATRHAIERFQREGEAALQVEHQHIVRCFELGHHGETHFIVMELVEGTTLAKHIETKWLLPARETARIGHEVALALEHARQRGIIHRDIKPSNIMLTRSGKVKLADLGLAKFFDQREDRPATITHTGAFMGTVDYCAPEQAEDAKRADTRSDIYSLGCTLYHCLTGQPPFAQGTNVQKIVAHREREPEPIRTLNDAVPQFFADLIAMRMLAKRPEERFQTPAEAAAALSPWAKGEGAALVDVARLQGLVDDEYAVEPAQRADSTDSDQPIASASSRSRRRGSSSSPAITSAIGGALRGLFVHDLSGKFLRLIALAGILGGLVWFWRADPIGLNQYLPGQPKPETAKQGENPIAPPSFATMSLPTSTPSGTVPTGMAVAPMNTWYESTDPIVIEAAGKANAGDLNGAVAQLRQKLAQSPDDRGALQLITQLAFLQGHALRMRGDQAGACNGYFESGGYARRLANGHTNLSAREKSLVSQQIYNEACAYALTGQSDKAIESLKEAIRWGWSDFATMDQDSDLNSIRNLPAFKAIVK